MTEVTNAIAPSTKTMRRADADAPAKLSHLAWVTADAAATAAFYTNVMRMQLVTAVVHERIPSTGDTMPYLHVFFRMQDGSTIAFFEVPDLPDRPPVAHPAYNVFDHLALEVATPAEVDAWHRWLLSKGIDVMGPVDHTIIYSVYFLDPNGIRLEITAPLVDNWNDRPEQAQRTLDAWVRTKAEAAANGENRSDALHRLVVSSAPTMFDG